MTGKFKKRLCLPRRHPPRTPLPGVLKKVPEGDVGYGCDRSSVVILYFIQFSSAQFDATPRNYMYTRPIRT